MNQNTSFPLPSGWKLLLLDLGLDPEDILRRARLAPDLLNRSGVKLNSHDYFSFWHALEEEAKDPSLAIKLVEAVQIEHFEPALFAALCSPHLKTALGRIAHYKRLVLPMALHLSEDEDGLSLTLDWLEKTVSPPDIVMTTELVYFTHLARVGTRSKVAPLAVEAPLKSLELKGLEEYLGASVRDAPKVRLVFSREDAERPFLTANEAIWAIFEPELARRLSQLTESATMAERVRAALFELLPAGATALDDVAAKLHVSARTLQRKLRGEEAKFNDVLAKTREDLARHYLGKTHLSPVEISFLLGFQDSNSFFRAFKGWTGDSPEHFRRALSGV